MANPARGEVELTMGGATFKVALSLGVLAELEDAFKIDSFEDALSCVFKDRFSARDYRTFLIALLKGNAITINEETMRAVNSIQPAEMVAITNAVMKMINHSGITAEGEGKPGDAPLSPAASAGDSG